MTLDPALRDWLGANAPELILVLAAAWLFLFVLLLLVVGSLRRLAGRWRRYRGLDRSTPAELEERLDTALARLAAAEAGLAGCIRRVGLVRYDAFEGSGGRQSFSAALLDDRGDGLLFTSIFSRSDVRVYAKPVRAGKSSYTLTDEEQTALEQAREDRPPEAAPP